MKRRLKLHAMTGGEISCPYADIFHCGLSVNRTAGKIEKICSAHLQNDDAHRRRV